ncbi:hypothetical protein [Streptococcus danieliae]|uniref:hypothetical protein n=1 Tax=Streptococcus danieliae TaxID=747656 RepID=UPI0019248680|nr:hypothetical protein [Streptococcus danieliae]
MKKSKTIISTILLTTILASTIAPNVSTVYAFETLPQVTTSDTNITPTNSLTEEQIDLLADDIQSLHPDVSKDWIEEVIERQLQGDYSLPSDNSPFRVAWQGVTVGQMGAAIDTAISLALGGTVSGLANLIKVKGAHAVKSAIRSAVSQYLGGWIVNSVFIDYAVNLFSPGTYLAQQWDARDSVPNNGRINF